MIDLVIKKSDRAERRYLMRITNNVDHKILFGIFATFAIWILVPQTALCQTEKLGIVRYTPPSGMTKLPKENVVVFSEMNQATGKYCIISLYGATPGTGSAQSDFTREWNNLAVKTLQAEANPTTDKSEADGWTVFAGGAPVKSEVGTGLAFLTVISGFGKTVSILAVFNDTSYVGRVDAFIKGIDLDKTVAPSTIATAATAVAAPTLDQWGNLFIPPPTRQLTIADLVGNWGDNPGRISTQYVFRDSGSHAGTDSLHFTSKWTIDGDGRYVNDFFEVRNGKKLSDRTTGSITIAGLVISIKREKSTARYVVRGWLELPDITILKVAGPWYDGNEIPERTFTDPPDSYMLTSKWVRTK